MPDGTSIVTTEMFRYSLLTQQRFTEPQHIKSRAPDMCRQSNSLGSISTAPNTISMLEPQGSSRRELSDPLGPSSEQISMSAHLNVENEGDGSSILSAL